MDTFLYRSTVSYRADMTYSFAGDLSGDIQVSVPTECLASGETCADVEQQLSTEPDFASIGCATDQAQIGRESRINAPAACGLPKPYPGDGADPVRSMNPHLADVYHFVNTTAATSCFDFTLTYDATVPQRYMTAYTTYDPANIGAAYLGDVGSQLVSPQPMGITVPAGSSIDVVVFAIDVGVGGVGPYTLSCTASTVSGAGGTGGAGGAGAGGAAGGAGGAGGAGSAALAAPRPRR